MATQWSVAVRNAENDAKETTIGTSAKFEIRTGAPPASCATADSGTLLASLSLPSDYLGASSNGVKSLAGSWTGTGAAAGTPGHWRVKDNAGTTCHGQGTCGQQVQLTTNGSTSANGNVLNFAATTGVVVGMKVSGSGVPTNARVLAVGGTTVTLDRTVVTGVSSAVQITFAHDVTVDAATISIGQTVTVSTFAITRGNA